MAQSTLLLKLANLAALAAILVLLLAWVWGGNSTTDEVLTAGSLISQIVMGAAIATVLNEDQKPGGRMPGIVLAAGLAGTALVGLVLLESQVENPAVLVAAVALAPCLALGLMAVLAGTRHWELLWLGTTALLGALTHVAYWLMLAKSFMN